MEISPHSPPNPLINSIHFPRQSVRNSLYRATFISALGGIFEFYDFVIFAVFAPQIGRTFFPANANASATLKTFAVFAVGYFARPLGGILWAHLADRRGRAHVFAHTVLGMAASTLLISILPGYASLGLASPILLVGLRVLQGMFLGGEIPSSLCWLSEHAGPKRAGLVTAILLAGVNSGILLGQGVALTIETLCGHENSQTWAWRLAFLFGSAIGVASYFIRRTVGETSAFIHLHDNQLVEKIPLKSLLKDSSRSLISGFLLCSLHAWVVASLFLALPAFLTQATGMPQNIADTLSIVSSTLGSLIYILSGWLADHFGAKRLCIGSLILLILCAFPAYATIHPQTFENSQLTSSTLPSLLATLWKCGALPLLSLGVIGGAFIGAYLSILPRLFATPVRVSGIAISYNTAAALVGGTGPLLMLYATGKYGPLGVASLLFFFATLSLLGLALIPKFHNPST